MAPWFLKRKTATHACMRCISRKQKASICTRACTIDRASYPTSKQTTCISTKAAVTTTTTAHWPFRDGVVREELAERPDDVLAVEHGAVGADVAAGGVRRLEDADMRVGGVADVHVRLHGVGVRLGGAVQVLEHVHQAGVHRRLQRRPLHQHRVHHHQVHPARRRLLPRRLLRHRLPVAVPVLTSQQCKARSMNTYACMEGMNS